MSREVIQILGYRVSVKRVAVVVTTERSCEIVGKEESGLNKVAWVEKPTERLADEPVYEQVIDSLDLQAVIRAVNGMGNGGGA
jgi:hypothetical protein